MLGLRHCTGHQGGSSVQFIGAWILSKIDYTISEVGAGNETLQFEQTFPNGEHASSILSPHESWLKRDEIVNVKERVGTIRCRPHPNPWVLASHVKVRNETVWGPDRTVVSKKGVEPKRVEEQTSSAEGPACTDGCLISFAVPQNALFVLVNNITSL